MTRNIRAFLAVLMIGTLLIPMVASAGWHTDEIGWHVSYTNGSTQGIAQRDTLLAVLNGAASLDTSQVFTLDPADQMQRGLGAPGLTTAGTSAGSDTTVAAFLVVQVDSGAVVPNITNGTFTLMLEGKIGGLGSAVINSAGWCRIDSTVTTLGAVADQSLSIPIRSRGVYGSPWSFSALRVRSIGGTGIMSPAHLFLRWWTNDSSNPHRP